VESEQLTCSEVGTLLGLSKASASGKMVGRIGWTTNDLMILADHFHVSTDYLLGRTDREEVRA
jgi:hypothetical protein